MKKRDIYLVLVLLIIAVLMFVFINMSHQTAGNRIRITIDGEVYGTYSLEDDQTIEIKEDLGINTVQIKDGRAKMIEADCPDGYCMDQNEISRENETIVCLPHKLVVEVILEDETGSEIDGISK